jgi:heme o synthase
LYTTKNITTGWGLAQVKQKLQDYKMLIKLNLSLMVVFSSMVGYWVSPNVLGIDWVNAIILFAGGLCVTGAANACNEIMELHTDKLMKRTSTRPIPTGRMSVGEAMIFATVALIVGLALLWINFNLLTAFLSLASFVLYVLAYTPLKRISNINVFVGAIPGAMPALIGWCAANNNLAIGAWVLFILQFMWQFPHFWSIAWLAHDDYTAAGLKMLPTNSKDNRFTSMQCVHYTIALLSLSVLPVLLHLTGWWAVAIIALGGLYFVYRAILFYKHNDNPSARQLMFASFFYLPIVYIALLIDKL